MRRLARVVPLAMAVAGLLGAAPALAANGTGVSGKPTVAPQTGGGNGSLDAKTTTLDGGAKVVPTTRTIAHWRGSSTDPTNGVTYSYNMAGSDPFNCSGTG